MSKRITSPSLFPRKRKIETDFSRLNDTQSSSDSDPSSNPSLASEDSEEEKAEEQPVPRNDNTGDNSSYRLSLWQQRTAESPLDKPASNNPKSHKLNKYLQGKNCDEDSTDSDRKWLFRFIWACSNIIIGPDLHCHWTIEKGSKALSFNWTRLTKKMIWWYSWKMISLLRFFVVFDETFCFVILLRKL